MIVSRMTEAFVELVLWADFRQVCIAAAGGGMTKLEVLQEKQGAGPNGLILIPNHQQRNICCSQRR